MSKYTEKDAANDTDSGGKETSNAWHTAREDARSSGEISPKESYTESGISSLVNWILGK